MNEHHLRPSWCLAHLSEYIRLKPVLHGQFSKVHMGINTSVKNNKIVGSFPLWCTRGHYTSATFYENRLCSAQQTNNHHSHLPSPLQAASRSSRLTSFPSSFCPPYRSSPHRSTHHRCSPHLPSSSSSSCGAPGSTPPGILQLLRP